MAEKGPLAVEGLHVMNGRAGDALLHNEPGAAFAADVQRLVDEVLRLRGELTKIPGRIAIAQSQEDPEDRLRVLEAISELVRDGLGETE